MTENDIIQQGTVAKYIIAPSIQGLDLTAISFSINIMYGSKSITIDSTDMDMVAGTSNYLLVFNTSKMVGKIIANLTMDIPDNTVPGGIRREVDSQIIAFVVTSPCPKFVSCPCESGTHDVTYTRTEESNISSLYNRLLDCNLNRICDNNGNYLFVLKTNN